jgi:hypothetical protein
MKKKIIILMALMSSISAYAYDYGESSGSGWLVFVSLVLLVWGVLEIILFFKIGKMTNDVASLKQSLVDNRFTSNVSSMTLAQLKQSVKRKHFLGYTDAAENEISMFAYKKLTRLEGKTLQKDENGEQFVWIPMGAETKKTDPDAYIQAVINEVKPLYEAIGREVPERLSNLTYKDFISFAK